MPNPVHIKHRVELKSDLWATAEPRGFVETELGLNPFKMSYIDD